MAAPGFEEVMAFLTGHGFARAASALRDDVIARGGAGFDESPPPSLPPLRTPATSRRIDADSAAPPSSASSSGSSDAFVSMGSPPSGLLNPYGIWSPQRARSEASSSSEVEFGTAREYINSDFFNEGWWYDDKNDPFHLKKSSDNGCDGVDKFIMPVDSEERPGKPESCNLGCEGCAEIFNCSSPLCDCCTGAKKVDDRKELEKVAASSSTVYGRYQIIDDHTETLDECGEDGFPFKRVDEQGGDVVFEGDLLLDGTRVDEKKTLEEFQMLNSYAADAGIFATGSEPANELKNSEKLVESTRVISVDNVDNTELQKEGYTIQPFPEKDDAYELGDYGPMNKDFQDSGAVLVEEEDPETNVDLALCDFHKEYETFDLRIIHRKNRTGFEENKDLPIPMNMVIAGRYYVTEYLGSAAFSKVVQAHDLHTGMDVCLKIIKNDKDFFDQSLDEIKLLKFVNKYDPTDDHHILRLYDYFYFQEHLFIVTELLRANLYEFQKYNQESGGEVYFTLPRIQAIARQCLEALDYLHHLRIIHCDLKPENILIKSYSRCEIKVIDLGSSCFSTDNLCLYVQSRSYRAPEVILGFPYDQKIDVWSLGCILAELYTGEVLFTNDSVVMMLARMIGIIGPIDMEMLAVGQEVHKYFTEDYDLYYKNEETDQIEYLIPEKSSLAKHLQASDTKFINFLSYLLQINPRRRPTASEALQHRWLSFSY
ncbi:uncharacterized protein [Typha angustifolia]|uniref:uncharacterized protein isoform X1 n=1 Tax=Typha angustifolia TaxID=59011 RepID=UPI003C2FE29A